METQRIVIDRKEARELYQQYKKHQHYSDPIDHEIQRAYQLIAQGRMVIRALESIKAAGVFESGLPKLAITRADVKRIYCRISQDGGAEMYPNVGGRSQWASSTARERSGVYRFAAGSFPEKKRNSWDLAEAVVPICPIHLRPKRGLANYQILWEAEWSKIIPKDPMLLRRIGKGDMWLVVAAWDLTEVERAALATRLNG